ncbi:hypothetical protein VCSRO64_3436 [Vibrio cholerae]|nr:hypothetical protein VCSRO107_3538 [Vibrio cholerae]GHX55155.1 hypothetical protein VCSRO64_3436 [Vibrio cholerae]GHY94024.1 hypothetical protein VCSRO75_3536 [Vibrio cholerae]GIA33308.1 hypothetical protein VCSRO85_2835 [Vibrio cholerae]
MVQKYFPLVLVTIITMAAVNRIAPVKAIVNPL